MSTPVTKFIMPVFVINTALKTTNYCYAALIDGAHKSQRWLSNFI